MSSNPSQGSDMQHCLTRTIMHDHNPVFLVWYEIWVRIATDYVLLIPRLIEEP
jgi:hypothetical protein